MIELAPMVISRSNDGFRFSVFSCRHMVDYMNDYIMKYYVLYCMQHYIIVVSPVTVCDVLLLAVGVDTIFNIGTRSTAHYIRSISSGVYTAVQY